MPYNFEMVYSDGDGGLVIEWKEKSGSVRLYFKVDRLCRIELQEMEGKRMGECNEHVAAIKRIRELLEISDE